MQYLPPFGESHFLQCTGSQQPSYSINPAFQVSSSAVSAGSCQDLIVGEGEVVAVANPDGTGSFFFLPTAVRWSPDLCSGSGCFRNFCPNKNFTSGIWLVTSISNPVPVQVFNQVFQKRGCAVPPPVRSFVSDVNINSIPTSSCDSPPFPLKFHNDGCTSTSDLHYFFPSLRCREWIPHLGACVQVDLPPKERNIYHYECVTKPNGGNAMSVRCYDNNSIVESNSMSVDEDVSTLPETKDQYVFTVTESGMQTRTGISQPTQMFCNLDTSVEMQTCEVTEEAKTSKVCAFVTPIQIKSTTEQKLSCACDSFGLIGNRMSKTNRILKFQELPSQTDPNRQSQPTETFCTCSRELCECNVNNSAVNDKLIATFENSNIQTDPKTQGNATQMCCCFNSNCGTCDCIFNDGAKAKHKLTTTFEENIAQTDLNQRPPTVDTFSSCKPESCDQSTDRSDTLSFSCESDCQTPSKEIKSRSTETYACVCEYCNCGEDSEESGEDEEQYCTCRTGYCCCNPNASTHNTQKRETEIKCSDYNLY